MANAREIQKQYYQETARDYDKVHSSEAEHRIGLAYIVCSSFICWMSRPFSMWVVAPDGD